jgi:hypothetical protein
MRPWSHPELAILIDHEEAGLRRAAHPVPDTQALKPFHKSCGVMSLEHWTGNP